MKKTAKEFLTDKLESMKRDFVEMDLLLSQALQEKKQSESLWTVKQTADYLNCAESTVYAAYLSGKLPYRQTIGGIRFDPEVVRNHAVN